MSIEIKDAVFTHHVTTGVVMSFENDVKQRLISIELTEPHHNNNITLIMPLAEAQKLTEGLIREIKKDDDNEHSQ